MVARPKIIKINLFSPGMSDIKLSLCRFKNNRLFPPLHALLYYLTESKQFIINEVQMLANGLKTNS